MRVIFLLAIVWTYLDTQHCTQNNDGPVISSVFRVEAECSLQNLLRTCLHRFALVYMQQTTAASIGEIIFFYHSF